MRAFWIAGSSPAMTDLGGEGECGLGEYRNFAGFVWETSTFA
jgi:hypothetical protein